MHVLHVLLKEVPVISMRHVECSICFLFRGNCFCIIATTHTSQRQVINNNHALAERKSNADDFKKWKFVQIASVCTTFKIVRIRVFRLVSLCRWTLHCMSILTSQFIKGKMYLLWVYLRHFTGSLFMCARLPVTTSSLFF
jgi:hypothetical protein